MDSCVILGISFFDGPPLTFRQWPWPNEKCIAVQVSMHLPWGIPTKGGPCGTGGEGPRAAPHGKMAFFSEPLRPPITHLFNLKLSFSHFSP